MIRWMRVVTPPSIYFGIFAIIYGGVTALFLFVELKFGPGPPGMDIRENTAPILGLGIVTYAMWRILRYHPAFNAGYCKWLAASPWSSKQPLPNGPVHLVVQDGLLIGSVLLVAWSLGETRWFWMPQIFLLAYAILAAITLALTRQWHWAYVVAIGIGAMIWQWREHSICLGIAVITYVLAAVGINKSLARFSDWHESVAARKDAFTKAVKSERFEQLGWPFARLAPLLRVVEFPLSPRWALSVGLLVGWLAFALASQVPDKEGQHIVLHFFTSLVMMVPVGRLAVYSVGYAPPISLLGRIVTWRWIIPGFDQILVVPLLAVLAGLILIGAGLWFAVSPLLFMPGQVALVLFISLGFGPKLRTWRLTGQHQITPGPARAGMTKVG